MHSLEMIVALNKKPELAQKGANIKLRDARRRSRRYFVRCSEDIVLGPYSHAEARKKMILTGGELVDG